MPATRSPRSDVWARSGHRAESASHNRPMSLARVVRAPLRRLGVDLIRYDAEHVVALQRRRLLEERGFVART